MKTINSFFTIFIIALSLSCGPINENEARNIRLQGEWILDETYLDGELYQDNTALGMQNESLYKTKWVFKDADGVNGNFASKIPIINYSTSPATVTTDFKIDYYGTYYLGFDGKVLTLDITSYGNLVLNITESTSSTMTISYTNNSNTIYYKFIKI